MNTEVNEQPEVEITAAPKLTFAQKWHAEKLLKKAKKKSRKQLQQKGYTHSEATALVKQAVKSISSNKPMKRAAGRGG